jgi:DNA-binding NtrC family response regulator
MPTLPNDDDKAPPGAPTAVRLVVVHDPRMERVPDIDDVLARCGLTPNWIPPSRFPHKSAGPSRLALVGIAEQPVTRSPVLDDIRRLKSDGCTVLCYARGASTWTLGVRCRLLLAGAAHVFDTAEAGFASELNARLVDLLAAAIERDRETRLIKQQMLGLGVVGSSAGMTTMFRWIVSASAVSDLPVLIVGETGTGKELAARAIHRLDPRRSGRPFVAVNCGAISPALAESELFGHRRGAFTGADHDRPGLIRGARGGVLFLDEVGDLDPNLQGKLLRVLQERRVLALGDDQEVPVDVRIIAATNRDLDEMVKRREFRSDLFHRLNVISIRVPSLRERPEDVEPLVRHFLARCAEETRDGAVSASREFVDALRRVELPGNVRQLENVVRRAVVTSKRGDQLRLSNLPPELWLELSRADGAAIAAASPPLADEDARVPEAADRLSPLDPVAVLDATSWKLEQALDLCEQQLLAAALGASSGNRSRAARLLGISPRCIFNKMRKYRLSA